MYKLTYSLLNSWLYATDSEATRDKTQSFLLTLGREPIPDTPAMQAGREFESAVNQYVVDGKAPQTSDVCMRAAITRIGDILSGGQPQVNLTRKTTVCGEDLQLFGIADYIKAGKIYDIKTCGYYEYGKYYSSPQHKLYLSMCPNASKFQYLIFDGTYLYTEDYYRDSCEDLNRVISQFLTYLNDTNLITLYHEKWRI